MITQPQWLDQVIAQEALLRFDAFSNEDALKVGLAVYRAARDTMPKGVAVRVILDGVTVFEYKMPGTNARHDWWMMRKLNVAKETGKSTLRVRMEIEEGLCADPWRDKEDTHVACGGCIPIFLKTGEIAGYVLVSGVEHQQDHQLAADALAGLMGIAIPRIERTEQ